MLSPNIYIEFSVDPTHPPNSVVLALLGAEIPGGGGADNAPLQRA